MSLKELKELRLLGKEVKSVSMSRSEISRIVGETLELKSVSVEW